MLVEDEDTDTDSRIGHGYLASNRFWKFPDVHQYGSPQPKVRNTIDMRKLGKLDLR